MSAWLRRWGLWILGAIALLLPGAGLIIHWRGRAKGRAEAERDQQAAAGAVIGELAKQDATIDRRTASLRKIVNEELRARLAREPTEEEVQALIERARGDD